MGPFKDNGRERHAGPRNPRETWDVRSVLTTCSTRRGTLLGRSRRHVLSPSPTAPALIGDDKEVVATFEQSRSDLIDAFRGPGLSTEPVRR